MNYCKQCNELLSDGAAFCPKCGYKVEETYNQPQKTNNIVVPQKKTNVCSILAIIFGAIGIIPFLNFLFLPAAIILAIIGAILSKNRKKGVTIASAIVVVISLVVSIAWLTPAFTPSETPSGNNGTSTNSTPTTEELTYTEIYEGGKIETDFVLITIDEVSTTSTIRSINSSTVLNADAGEELVYIKGTIKNKSNTSYDLGSMGSYSYSSNVDTMIDCKLKMSNGEQEYGSLLIDDGGIYGIISDGTISPQETVTYYFAFKVDKSQSTYYNNGEILIAFADNFKEEPNYKHSNCEYLYKIKVK